MYKSNKLCEFNQAEQKKAGVITTPATHKIYSMKNYCYFFSSVLVPDSFSFSAARDSRSPRVVFSIAGAD